VTITIFLGAIFAMALPYLPGQLGNLPVDAPGKALNADGQVFVMMPQGGHLEFKFLMQGLYLHPAFLEFFENQAQNGPEDSRGHGKQGHHGPHVGRETHENPFEKIEGGLSMDIFLKIEDYHGQRVAQ